MSGGSEAASFAAGFRAKSDCLARFAPGAGPFRVRVESSVSALFGKAIEAAARRVAAGLGIDTGELSISDDGALDFVVEARAEAAIRAAFPLLRITSNAGPSGVPSARGRKRRSRLYLPGNQPDLLPNAGLFGADCLVLDLEDSVPPARKAEARVLARRCLESCRDFFGGSEILVRVNPLSGPFGRDDLAEIAGAFPQALVLPKCESAAEVEALDRELARLEYEAGIAPGSILVMPLIETARGVLAAASIAAASSRNAALCFGAEDFALDIGARRSPGGEESLLARSLIVLAAAAAGIQAHDSVYSDSEDDAGLAASCSAAKALGFSGKGLVHPRQISIAHNSFDLSAEELAAAARVVRALEAAEAAGSGVASLEGKMIDAPVAARARRIVSEAS